jgi:shikimate kinase
MAFQLISHLRLRPHNGSGIKQALCGAKDGDTEELVDRLKGTCIHLVGMTGCGKSTVAESLAKELRYRFLDTDQLVEYMIEMPITDYFKQEGELSFRNIEHQVLSQLTQYTRVVVATGGGIVTKSENWGLLQQGVVVYLDLSPEHIFQRLIHNPEEVSKRPLLHAGDPLQSLQELNTARKDLYLQADIHCVVNPAHSPEQTAQRVVEHIQRFLDANPPRWRTWKEQRQAKANEMAAVVRSAFCLRP